MDWEGYGRKVTDVVFINTGLQTRFLIDTGEYRGPMFALEFCIDSQTPTVQLRDFGSTHEKTAVESATLFIDWFGTYGI